MACKESDFECDKNIHDAHSIIMVTLCETTFLEMHLHVNTLTEPNI